MVIRLRNVEGAMAKCGEAVSEMGFKMLTGFVNAPITSPVATWSFVADVTDSKANPREFHEGS